jgi:hypothetical protein
MLSEKPERRKFARAPMLNVHAIYWFVCILDIFVIEFHGHMPPSYGYLPMRD